MKLKDITVIVLMVSLMMNVWLLTRPERVTEKTVEIVKTDTIVDVVRDFDTVFINNTKYKNIYHYDTIHHNQLVYIRDTVCNYEFRELDYTLGINAVRLDNYKLDIHAKDTVTVTNTVTTIVKQKSKPFGFGLFGGLGYDPYNKTFGPQIGLGITLNLTK